MLKLFYAVGSCSLASHIALEEAGADYEAVAMSTKLGDQRKPEYLAINPKGRVPALVTDRGILTETPAILAWIAQTWPAAKLAPLDDPFAFAKAQAFNSYLCSTVHVAHAHKHRGYRWADDPAALAEMTRQGPGGGSGLLPADRGRNAGRPLGAGRGLFDLRSLPLHPGWLAGRRWDRYRSVSEGRGSQRTDPQPTRSTERSCKIRLILKVIRRVGRSLII